MGFCTPSKEDLKEQAALMQKSMNKSIGSFTKYMSDLAESWKIILVMAFVSMIVTLIYLFLLRWITKPILYISLFLILILGVLVSVWCFQTMQEHDEDSDDYKYSMAAGAVAAILTVLYVVFLCCNWTNI